MMNERCCNLGQSFLRCADRNPSQVALRGVSGETTYAELEIEVSRLTNYLATSGYKRGQVIAIANDKHPHSLCLMLAALRLGVPYVSLDTSAPTSRNLRILRRSSAKTLFLEPGTNVSELSNQARLENIGVVVLDSEIFSAQPLEPLPEAREQTESVDGETVAYIMFTSGSTGEPKGVAVTHQNVLSFLAWSEEYFAVGTGDVLAGLNPMYFDNSVFDFFTALFTGATLVPVNRDLLQRPYELVKFVELMRCTIWFSVPSMIIFLLTMKALTPQSLSDLRVMIFGGEGFPKTELSRLFSLLGDRVRLVNVYGPTEATCICSAHSISEGDFEELAGLPPLGRLNSNFDAVVVDDEGRECSDGELHLLGPNVAAGYFNDVNRSREVFYRCEDTSRFMKHAYKTGDLVRRVDGVLYFVGRVDSQIKHLGHRIELGEIESSIATYPGVSQVAVVYRRSRTSFGHIVAFVASEVTITSRELMDFLRANLPSYMVPSRLHMMRTLPTNPNGKVDRKGLADGTWDSQS